MFDFIVATKRATAFAEMRQSPRRSILTSLLSYNFINNIYFIVVSVNPIRFVEEMLRIYDYCSMCRETNHDISDYDNIIFS